MKITKRQLKNAIIEVIEEANNPQDKAMQIAKKLNDKKKLTAAQATWATNNSDEVFKALEKIQGPIEEANEQGKSIKDFSTAKELYDYITGTSDWLKTLIDLFEYPVKIKDKTINNPSELINEIKEESEREAEAKVENAIYPYNFENINVEYVPSEVAPEVLIDIISDIISKSMGNDDVIDLIWENDLLPEENVDGYEYESKDSATFNDIYDATFSTAEGMYDSLLDSYKYDYPDDYEREFGSGPDCERC